MTTMCGWIYKMRTGIIFRGKDSLGAVRTWAVPLAMGIKSRGGHGRH